MKNVKFSLNPLIAYHQLFQDPKTRLWLILGTIIYLISWFDFIPEFFPVIGIIDDGILLTMLICEIALFMLSGNFMKAKNKRPTGRVVDEEK